MFTGKFISSRSGVSKNNTNWYSIQVIADTVTNSAEVAQLFCTENAFNNARALEKLQSCKIACGVDDKGRLIVSNIKAEA